MVSAGVRSNALALLLLIHCLLLLQLFYGGFVFYPCFVALYLVAFLVLQPSRWGRESWLLTLFAILCYVTVGVLTCVSSSRCRGFVCNL